MNGKTLVKQILDWLPFNNKKSVIGFVILALGVVKLMYPELQIITDIIGWLQAIPATELVTAGAAVTGIGLGHKLLKAEAEVPK